MVGVDLERISVPVQGITEVYSSCKGVSVHEFPVSPLYFEQTDYILTIRSRNGSTDSPESAFERATLPIGIETRLKTVEWKRREVLIGLVPDQKHLDIFLKSNMYFTRRFDTNNLPIRYVALYEKGTGILHYGEVVSWYRDDRYNLPGRSKNQNQPYHVFKVLKWEQLDRTISISEYGPNPVAYTNYFLLNNSSTYSELLLTNEADYRFFTELKRRTGEAIISENEESTAFEFRQAKVLIDKNDIHVYSDHALVDTCTVHEFVRHPNAIFRRIQRYAVSQPQDQGTLDKGPD